MSSTVCTDRDMAEQHGGREENVLIDCCGGRVEMGLLARFWRNNAVLIIIIIIITQVLLATQLCWIDITIGYN